MQNYANQQIIFHNEQVIRKLVALIDQNQEEISLEWAKAITKQMPESSYGKYPIKEIARNNILGLGLIRDLLKGIDIFSPTTFQGIPDQLLTLVRKGIPLEDVVEGSLIFQEVILLFIPLCIPVADPLYQEVVSILRESTQRMVMGIVKYYSAEMNKKLHEEHQKTVLMLDMARQTGSTLELKDIIQQACHGIADASGAEHCIIFLFGENGENYKLGAMTHNIPNTLSAFINDSSYQSLLPSQAPDFKHFYNKKKLLELYHAEADEFTYQITGIRMGVQALIAIPVIHKNKLLAVAIVFNIERDHVFSVHQLELSTGLATVVAPAIDNARLYEEVERIATLEEREKLAREIHDDLAQTICAIQFRIFLASDSLKTGEIIQAKTRIEEVGKMLDLANSSMHELIFNLRSVSNMGKGFLETLEEYLESYRTNFRINIQLETDQAAIDSLDDLASIHVIRIIQESLSNAHKHGYASQVFISILREGQGTNICIEDNGKGFDLDKIDETDREHFGLAIMWERTKKISGDLIIESNPGYGTSINLFVPD